MPLNQQRLLAGRSGNVLEGRCAQVGNTAVQRLELVNPVNQRRCRPDNTHLLHRRTDGYAVRVVEAIVYGHRVKIEVGGQHESLDILAAQVLGVGEHAHIRVAQAQIQCAPGDQVVRVAVILVIQVAQLDAQGPHGRQVQNRAEPLCVEVTYRDVL